MRNAERPRRPVLTALILGPLLLGPELAPAQPCPPDPGIVESFELNPRRRRQLVDVDGDGRADLVSLSRRGASSEIRVWRNSGQLELAEATRIETSANGVKGVRAADLTGDGAVDLLVYGDLPILLINNGRGVFAARRPLDPRLFTEAVTARVTRVRDVAIGDVTGDGYADVVSLNELEPNRADPNRAAWREVRVLVNDGAGLLRRGETTALRGHTFDVARLADLDGDEALDLVLVSSGAAEQPGPTPVAVYAYLNRGGFRAARGVPLYVGIFERIAAHIGDLDGSGTVDFAIVRRSWRGDPNAADPNVSLAVYLNAGEGVFSAPERFPVRLPPTATLDDAGVGALIPGDLDMDGDVDWVASLDGYTGGFVALRNEEGRLRRSRVLAQTPSDAPGGLPTLIDLDDDGVAEVMLEEPTLSYTYPGTLVLCDANRTEATSEPAVGAPPAPVTCAAVPLAALLSLWLVNRRWPRHVDPDGRG